MAATMTLKSATPNSLKYEYAYDGSGSLNGDVLKAALVADAQTADGASPLAALLNATSDPEWSALSEGAQISVLLTPIVQSVAASCMAANLSNPGSAGLRLRATGVGLASGDKAIVEVRFNTTPSR